MASFFIYWQPANNGTSIQQIVQYKEAVDSSYTDYDTIASQVDSILATGFNDDVLYDFRVANECSEGGTLYTPAQRAIKISCPELTISASSNLISYSFNSIGDYITTYYVELFKNGVLNTYNSHSPTFVDPLTGSFSIESGNIYNIKIKAVAQGGAIQECPLSADIIATCIPITNISATVTP
jgi:hypothetical protein